MLFFIVDNKILLISLSRARIAHARDIVVIPRPRVVYARDIYIYVCVCVCINYVYNIYAHVCLEAYV